MKLVASLLRHPYFTTYQSSQVLTRAEGAVHIALHIHFPVTWKGDRLVLQIRLEVNAVYPGSALVSLAEQRNKVSDRLCCFAGLTL